MQFFWQLIVFVVCKSQVNDLVRDKIRENNNNDLPLAGEILAGGCVSTKSETY